MSFAKPASAEGINWDSLKGTLLLVEPTSVEEGVNTVHGLANPVKATVTVLDGPDAGTENVDTLIFPKVLISQVKGQLGQMVLGRLTQGQAKPGQSAPWKLAEATAEDIELGERYVAHRSKSTFTKPAAEQPAPSVPAQSTPAPAAAGKPDWA